MGERFQKFVKRLKRVLSQLRDWNLESFKICKQFFLIVTTSTSIVFTRLKFTVFLFNVFPEVVSLLGQLWTHLFSLRYIWRNWKRFAYIARAELLQTFLQDCTFARVQFVILSLERNLPDSSLPSTLFSLIFQLACCITWYIIELKNNYIIG